MKSIFCFALVVGLAVRAHAQATSAPPDAAKGKQPTPPPASKRAALTYKPPKNAERGTRIDGDAGTRSGGSLPSLYVLAPDHTALTTREQPSLFWFQSAPAAKRLELTLIEPRKSQPLLKVSTEKSDRAGIHRVSLARHGVKLARGVTYKWSIALVPDPENRSQDIIASGTIRRVEPGPDLAAQLATAEPDKLPAIYAAHSIWYDAFETLSDRIIMAPEQYDLREQRAGLLAAVALSAAAAWERR